MILFTPNFNLMDVVKKLSFYIKKHLMQESGVF